MSFVPAPDSANPTTRRQLSVGKKLAFSAVVTLLFLIALDSMLAICGIKPLHLTSDPFVGFDRGTPLFVPLGDGELFRTNPAKLAFFNDQQFWAAKTPRTFRIFCLGGSTTFGHPYHDATSFTGWLRARLRDADPDRDWQVINCGGVSYASYRICHLMQELANYKPDLFIFYEGHNEFLEERTYGDLKERGQLKQWADFVRTRTRVGTAVDRMIRSNQFDQHTKRLPAEVEAILDRTTGPEQYHYDPQWKQAVVEHFRISLDRACSIARGAGARIILVKPAANLRDFSPFKSESGRLDVDTAEEWERLVDEGRRLSNVSKFDEATSPFIRAAHLNPRHALTQWEAGNALFRAGQILQAREFFVRAIDEDICPLRATSTICKSVEDAAQRNGVPCIDFPKLIEDHLESSVNHRIPGDESFLDHVHPTIEQNRRLAWKLYDQLVDMGIVPSKPSDAEMIDRVSHAVLDGIDQRQHALALVQVVQVLSWAGKNTEGLRLSERAEETYPGLSEVASYRGRLLEKLGKPNEALEFFVEAVRRNPNDSLACYRLGSANLQRKDYESARQAFAESLRNTPVQAPVIFQYKLRMGLGLSLVGLGRWAEAADHFRSALKLSPHSTDATAALDAALKNAGSVAP